MPQHDGRAPVGQAHSSFLGHRLDRVDHPRSPTVCGICDARWQRGWRMRGFISGLEREPSCLFCQRVEPEAVGLFSWCSYHVLRSGMGESERPVQKILCIFYL